jgi:hypothetical protein
VLKKCLKSSSRPSIWLPRMISSSSGLFFLFGSRSTHSVKVPCALDSDLQFLGPDINGTRLGSRIFGFDNRADVHRNVTDSSPAAAVLRPMTESRAPAPFREQAISRRGEQRSRGRLDRFPSLICFLFRLYVAPEPQAFYSRIRVADNDRDMGEEVHDGRTGYVIYAVTETFRTSRQIWRLFR